MAKQINNNGYNNVVANQLAGYEAKVKVHEGKNHLVVPVTMIVEGVLNGSHGPLLHLAEDFGKIPESWNDIPVVINHPEVNGVAVSAKSPDQIEKSIGRIYNTRLVGNRLRAEVWVEETKANAISPDTLVNINAGVEMEVSVGVFTDDEDIAGEYNGIKYNAIARNHKPDHLALLPCGVGACSLKDGCGIRANSFNKKGGLDVNEDMIKVLKSLNNEGYAISPIVINEEGLREKLDGLRLMVNGLDTEQQHHYLEEAYDNYVIYEAYNKDGERLMKQSYSVNAETGDYSFVGEPVEVEKQVSYVNKPKTNELVRTKFKTNLKKETMAENKCPKCLQKVNEIIANAALGFTEEDRTMLEGLSLKVLENIGVNTNVEEKVKEPKVEEKPVQVNAATIQTLSAEDKAALEFGKTMLAQRKADMIAGIQKNTEAGTWDDKELNAMSEPMLSKLYKSTVKEEPKIDYSLNGNNRSISTNEEIPPLMPIV